MATSCVGRFVGSEEFENGVVIKGRARTERKHGKEDSLPWVFLTACN